MPRKTHSGDGQGAPDRSLTAIQIIQIHYRFSDGKAFGGEEGQGLTEHTAHGL